MNFIEIQAQLIVSGLVRTRSEVCVIDKAALSGIHPALRRAGLRLLLTQVLGSPKDIEAVHIEDMLDLAEGNAGRSVDLPDGMVFVAGYTELYLGRDLSGLNPFPLLEGEHRLTIPGTTEIPGWKITASIINGLDSPPDCPRPQTAETMDFDKMGQELFVRPRLPGDTFQPSGMDGSKKLKNFFIDAKVARPWRGRIPLVVNPEHIVWVVGYRLDERVKVTVATKNILRLEFIQA